MSLAEENALKSHMRFPGKLIYIEKERAGNPYDADVLVISDTGNNRVIVVDESDLSFIE